MKVLVAYASKHGSTAEVAERIAARLTQRGLAVDTRDADQVVDVDIYDAAVVGSAVYYGSWLKEASDFVRLNRSSLADRPVWLFSVGPLGQPVDGPEQQPKELAEFRDAIAPEDHAVFFGSLDLERLSFPERMLVRALRSPVGDFRDWSAIDGWADGIAAELASRTVPAVRG